MIDVLNLFLMLRSFFSSGSSFARNPFSNLSKNKVIRFVLNIDVRSHFGKEQFVFLNWLPVPFMVDQIILSHVNNTCFMYGSAPNYLG